jgi:hypothetical protein
LDEANDHSSRIKQPDPKRRLHMNRLAIAFAAVALTAAPTLAQDTTVVPGYSYGIYPPNSGPCAYPPAVGPFACSNYGGPNAYGDPYAYAPGSYAYGGAPYASTSPYRGSYAYAPGSYAYSGAPYAYGPGGAYAQYDQFYSLGYTREGDIATEPDPNVRLQLRREQNLNEGTYNY